MNMSNFLKKAQAVLSNTYAELNNPEIGYSANHFAFRSMLNSFVDNGARNIVEIGIGHGKHFAGKIREGHRPVDATS